MSKVAFERRGAVARVTLDHAQAQNAFDVSMAEDILIAIRAADRDAEARAILLDADGSVFSAGAAVGALAALGDGLADAIGRVAECAHEAIGILAYSRKPVVCAVQGPVAGLGLGLALACDVVFGSDTSTYTLGHAALGLPPDGGLTFLLPRLVGLRKAQELIFTSRKLDALEALNIGLISRVVVAGRLAETAMAVARQMSNGPTEMFGATKDMLRMEGTLSDHLAREAFAALEAARTRDGKEGILASAQRRRPQFAGS